MRKIDWSKALTETDVAWLRQAGFMSEERIAAHQAEFGSEMPEDETVEDVLTKDALDSSARMADRVEGTGAGSPELVTPTEETPDEGEEEPDDYESWKVADLEAEVVARNDLADKRGTVSSVVVNGSGKDGKVLKADLIAGLRVWDRENPDALED